MEATAFKRSLVCAALCAIAVAGCMREKDRLDEEVRQLCAKDGGIKVYQRVHLTGDKFDESGFVNFYQRMSKNPLGPEYVFESQIDYYRRGNPEMWRNYYRVVRRIDGKVLGESISYSRRGGDLPGPWHESSFGCPEHTGDATLLKEVFVKAN
jgi:hypothetical protein